MAQWNIVVVALRDQLRELAEQTCERMENAWCETDEADFTVVAPDDLQESKLYSIDAAIFVEDKDDNHNAALALLMMFEEQNLPVIALTAKPVEADNPYEFAGAMVLPLSIEDKILGAILRGILHRQNEVMKLHDEVSLAQRFHGGLRTEITKMHEEMQLAAMVQREFLPTNIPSLHGVNFAALWRPAHYVSGDIFDICRLDEDHIGLFLADAAGHGVPAALMTMVICRSLITKEIEDNSYRILPPSEVLAELNTGMIRRQGRSSRFATAVYAVINCRTRHMSIAGAGHPPPKLMHADGTTTEIVTPGGLLGVFEEETFEQIEITLKVDDRMLVFSDGFEQAFPETAADPHVRKLPTEQYHSEFDAIATLNDPLKMIAAIEQRLDDHCGSLHQIDDLTLLCMHAGSLDGIKDPTDSAKNNRFSLTI